MPPPPPFGPSSGALTADTAAVPAPPGDAETFCGLARDLDASLTSRRGLRWAETPLGALEPQWTVEPNLESFRAPATTNEEGSADGRRSVSLCTQGAFNKLYPIDHGGIPSMLRVALPVDRYYKTASEVVTMEFVRRVTGALVPNVQAFCTNPQNAVGFEYIVMD